MATATMTISTSGVSSRRIVTAYRHGVSSRRHTGSRRPLVATGRRLRALAPAVTSAGWSGVLSGLLTLGAKIGIVAATQPMLGGTGYAAPPNPDDAAEKDVLSSMKLPKAWSFSTENTLQRRVRFADTSKGKKILEILQREFDTDTTIAGSHKGCQIKRQTQSTYTLACADLRVLLDEPHGHLIVDLDCPKGALRPADVLRLQDECSHLDGILERVLARHSS